MSTTITVRASKDRNGNSLYTASYGCTGRKIHARVFKYDNGEHAPIDAARKLIERLGWDGLNAVWVQGWQEEDVVVFVRLDETNAHLVPRRESSTQQAA